MIVNNAGVSQRDELVNMSVDSIMTLVNTNFVSNVLVVKAILQPFLDSTSPMLPSSRTSGKEKESNKEVDLTNSAAPTPTASGGVDAQAVGFGVHKTSSDGGSSSGGE